MTELWGTPPCTYAQWVGCVETLRRQAVPAEQLRLLTLGTLPEGEALARRLAPRLTEAVNAMLSRAARHLTVRLRQCLEGNETEEIPRALRRFRRETDACLFFRQLAFLPADYRAELEAALRREAQRCWDQVVEPLRRQCAQTADSRWEGLLDPLRRIRLFAE